MKKNERGSLGRVHFFYTSRRIGDRVHNPVMRARMRIRLLLPNSKVVRRCEGTKKRSANCQGTLLHPWEKPITANPSKGGDAKLRGYRSDFPRVTPVEPPNFNLWRQENAFVTTNGACCAHRAG